MRNSSRSAIPVSLEFRQLAGAGHGRPAHQRWQRELGVAVPSGVQVQEELGDGPLQLGAGAAEDGEPRAGQLRRPGEIEDAQALADGRVIGRLEAEHRQIAPPAYLDGEVLRVAVRAAVLRQVRDLQQQRLQLVIQFLLPPLTGRDLRLQGPATPGQLAGVLAALGRGLHLLRNPPGFGPRALDLADRGVALAEQAAQKVQVQLVAAPGQPAHGIGGRVEQYPRIVHQYVLSNSGSPWAHRLSGITRPAAAVLSPMAAIRPGAGDRPDQNTRLKRLLHPGCKSLNNRCIPLIANAFPAGGSGAAPLKCAAPAGARPAWTSPGRLGRLPDDLGRVLVHPQPLVRGRPHAPGLGPSGEDHIDHQHRLHPDRAAGVLGRDGTGER
jgi:hypothetical protein